MSDRTKRTGQTTGKTSKEQTSNRRTTPNSAAAPASTLATKDKSNRPENKPWRANMRAAEKKSSPETPSPPKSRENSSPSLKKTTAMEIKLENPALAPAKPVQNGVASPPVKPWENYRYTRTSETGSSPATSPKSEQPPPPPAQEIIGNKNSSPLASPSPPEVEPPPKAREPEALPPAPQPLASPTVETLSLDPPRAREEEENNNKPDPVQEPRRAINPQVLSPMTENQENEDHANNPTPPDSEGENNGVKMRQRQQRAPPPRVVNGATGAIARGLDALAESEMEENLEEIKRLDTQLDHLNECVDQVEERINKHNSKIRDMLETQKSARLTRRASFQQRVSQSQQEDQDFHNQVRAMLSKCNQSRRASVPVFSDEVQDLVSRSQAARGDDEQAEGATGPAPDQ